jgi:hypothetical protein
LEAKVPRQRCLQEGRTPVQNFVIAGRLQLTGSLQFAANLPAPGRTEARSHG